METVGTENDLKPKKKRWLWLVVGLAVVILIVGGFVFLRNGAGKKTEEKAENGTEPDSSSTKILTATIPQEILNNKFGFLGGGEEDNTFVGDVGAAWVRPHPGPFLWDAMQSGTGAEIDFSQTDKVAKANQGLEYGTLATLWPFANWDQEISANAAECQVSTNDEFLPKSKESTKKGRTDYLPKYRCKPTDWDKYTYWVGRVVERYDGDGADDMTGLKLPIKFWEMMNEPDLTSPEAEPRLDFWKGNEADYAELLIKTYAAIKAADSTANILVAGAAGGEKQFLDFYRQVFADKETHAAFDIANIHCISNDRQTHDFNVGAYKNMLAEFGLLQPIWVTEAEAFYGSGSADTNYQTTKISTSAALAAGAERIFFTRYSFDDFRTDMSQKSKSSGYDSATKYRELIKSFSNK
ncbi:MAG: glycosyl hydrolase [Patescibacteria group bacterium]